uniref:Uncharacterized protein n=1 Tax=Utricularia reniformis TaxID=192314 RepID=A0A1Y0B2H5_9LAMI|nr:hypothetical protein AEK19_MT1399 [Utricularia reniformis]ART31594.1 hypothetical protein AEK19_MT1399 [Utricularia reniformis]
MYFTQRLERLTLVQVQIFLIIVLVAVLLPWRVTRPLQHKSLDIIHLASALYDSASVKRMSSINKKKLG